MNERTFSIVETLLRSVARPERFQPSHSEVDYSFVVLTACPDGKNVRPQEIDESSELELTREKEKKLLEAAKRGDEEAFGRLVVTHRDRVIALAYSYLRHREEALDAAQDAFLKAYRNLRRFRGESAFSTWLYRITCNLCRDRLRQKARRPTDSLSDEPKFGSRKESLVPELVVGPADVGGRPFDKIKNRSPIG